MAWGAIIGGLIAGGGSLLASNQANKGTQQGGIDVQQQQALSTGALSPYVQSGYLGLGDLLRGFGMNLPPALTGAIGNGTPQQNTAFTSGLLGTGPSALNPSSGNVPYGLTPGSWNVGIPGQAGSPMTPGGGVPMLPNAPGATGAPGVGMVGMGQFLNPYNANTFQMDPGYLFNLTQGQSAINQQAAARGNFYSPGTMKDLMSFSQGLASNEFQSAFSRSMQTNQFDINSLLSLIGLGTGATNIGVQAGGTAASTMANLATQSGMNTAAGTMGAANALSGAYNTYQNNQFMQQMLNQMNQPSYNQSVGGYVGPLGYNPQSE